MKILLAGVPRSGTTWASRVLGCAQGANLVHEPDNVRGDPCGTLDEVGQFPVLQPGQVAPRYSAVWDLAFSGRWPRASPLRSIARLTRLVPRGVVRPAARILARAGQAGGPVIVKSVYSAFAIEWIADRYTPEVIVMRRHVLSVVASWLELGFEPYSPLSPLCLEDNPHVIRSLLRPRELAPPARDAPMVQHVAWTVGVLMSGYEAAIGRHPEWTVLSHEDLCKDPEAGYRRLYSELSLPWTTDAAAFLRSSNRPGKGADTNRIAGDQPGKWRRLLAPGDAAAAIAVLERFPLHATALEGTGTQELPAQPGENPGGS